MSDRFTGQTVVLAGAARGIGRAAAEIFAREGASVWALDRDEAALAAFAAKARDLGVAIRTRQADAMDEASVRAAVAAVIAQDGKVDTLVNAVGGSTVAGASNAPLDAMSLAEFESQVRFNLNGTFLFTQAVLPAMKARGGGTIVNVASIAARGDAFSNAAYSAAKAGVVALTRKVSLEVAPFGITCNAIAPGLTLSERMEEAMKGFSEDDLRKRRAAVPLGRLATADDQARVICFLASGDAAFITGTTLYVTGGA